VTEIYHVTVYSPLEASLLRTQEQFIKRKTIPKHKKSNKHKTKKHYGAWNKTID